MPGYVLAVLMTLQIGQGCVQIGQCGQICGDGHISGGRLDCLPVEKIRPVPPQEIPECTAPKHGWDSTCGAMMKFCRFYSPRSRPQDLMPLVEPLPPVRPPFGCPITLHGHIPCNFDELGPLPRHTKTTKKAVNQKYNDEAFIPSGTTACCDGCDNLPRCSHGVIRERAGEPSVVPAIQEKRIVHHKGDRWGCGDFLACYASEDIYEDFWTCKDKTNVLQVSEDGSGHWCVRF